MRALIKKILGRYRDTLSSIDYWERRYQAGGNSGSGSYNQLANFKAEFINRFLTENKIQSVVEFGCGDGNQISLIQHPRYIGLDVSRTSIKLCQNRFRDDVTKSFFLYDPFAFVDKSRLFQADLALSLDVIYHLIEDDIYDLYMEHLFQSSNRFVIIYSTNLQEARINHERNRKFTSWVDQRKKDWKLVSTLENPFRNEVSPESQSQADFFVYSRVSPA